MSRISGKLGELQAAYQRAVSLWPMDKLRPTHCYKSVLKQQMNKKFDKLSALRGDQLNSEITVVQKELDALNNLVSNRYRSQYKVSEAISDPVSHKGYYTQLLNSIDDAVKTNRKTSLRVD
ncbi:hypothetical protein BX661DRAFT_204246 [Kickxella alabastrina]|uniref:uncharacterized protein n=1 Tax=Kickxella alabastrina TaxID=61397 RepID=UPI00221F775D|nr:uncharacterized protein BX661DRAFT_204246 [Kickxella alabastrina]KAI7831955.1 hypothetical protein BX661DRAFT_204246 [Kickxella alabastrina]KAJ1941831.1 hypothetical protein GGF37_003377 [Kickxella alabastrina]